MYYKVDYLYRGLKNSSVVRANNRFEASSLVKREKGKIVVINIQTTSVPIEEAFANLKRNFNSIFKQKINIDEKISNIRQIAVMTDAGIPINSILEEIVLSTKNTTTKEMFLSITNDINSGKSMSQAIEPYRDEMGHIVTAMTKLGETTGVFSEAYYKLVDILENIRDNKAKFKKAIRYPITVLIAIAIAFIVVITQVVPKFREIFAELGADLPYATKFLLATESVFKSYGFYIFLVFIILFLLIRYFYKNSITFRYKIDKILASPKFYLIGKIIYLSNMYNYSLVLSELIKAGIPVSEALNIAVRVVGNRYIRKQLESINVNIGRGIGLSEAFNQTELFDNITIQMIRAGEGSGQIDRMLDKITDYYDMKFQSLIDNLSAYIEPIMLALIAGLVLLLALGIFLPMWDLGKAAKM